MKRRLLIGLCIMLSLFATAWAASHAMPADQLVKLSNKQLCDKGQAHWDKNELDSALICFNIVANRAERKQSREEQGFVSGALTAMASIYTMRFYDYDRAMHCLLKSGQYAQERNFNRQLVDFYEMMAVLEGQKSSIQHDFAFNPKSFELHRKAFNLAVRHDAPQHVMVIAMINMITDALGDHQLDLIKDELITFRDYKIFDTIPARDFAKHQCAAAINVLNEQYDSALYHLELLEQSIDVVDHAKHEYQCVAHENMYFVCRDKGDAAAALRELNIIEKIATEHRMKFALITVLLHKRDYYAAEGNTAAAKEYDLQYRKAKDQLLEESKAAKADEEKVLFKLNEANHEIKELSYKQRIQQTELIAVAVVALLLLTLLVLAWVSHRQTKEKNRSLYEQNQQLLANIDRMRQLRQEQERREREQQAQASEAQTASIPAAKYGRGKMDGDDISQVMEKVERVMDESEEIYSTEFSLDRLVELTGETESRVSQAINTSGHKYYELLNEYRVREACRRMNDKAQYGGLTIEAIGQSVGFKSRSNFVSTFKRIVGLTPSAYLKQPSKTKE